MDTNDSVNITPSGEENSASNLTDFLFKSGNDVVLSKDISVPIKDTADNKGIISQDISDIDANAIDSQSGKKHDVKCSNVYSKKGTSTVDKIADDKEELVTSGTDVDATVADPTSNMEDDSLSPGVLMQSASASLNQCTDDVMVTDKDSAQITIRNCENMMDYQANMEENNFISLDPRVKYSEPPNDHAVDNSETNIPRQIDFSQMSNTMDKKTGEEDICIVITDGHGENNTVTPSIGENRNIVASGKSDDNSVITGANDVSTKTNGISSFSKGKNYCRENWFVVLAICLIVLTIVGTIVLAFVIVPILTRKVIRPVRLPENVIPQHYVLEIRPHLSPEYFVFDGAVTITVLCVNSTNKLILHSKDLEIDENSVEVVNLDDGHSPLVLKTEYDYKNEFVIFSLCEHLQEGTKYNVRVSFRGKFAANLLGFGAIGYQKNGETKYMALTKFETIYARKAFPCFDEPALKATFDINLIRWKNMTSLSNMKQLATIEKDEEWEIDVYQRSVPMQTYLVAFVVGDMEKIQKGKVSIWTTENADNYQLALNITDKLLTFYELYLQVPYAISKLDQLAAETYSTPAMENWGLIIYYKQMIMPGYSSDQKIAEIISHELAHQWFGNLVTMKWWDELWLNEGFAAYFGYVGANIINPEWRMEEEMIEYIDGCMNYECGDSAGPNFPLVKPINSTEEITGYLTKIAYRKGAALVRMMHAMLGDATFRRGLKSYLEKNSFGNVDQEELWTHLTKAQHLENGIDLKKIMEPWTKQPYFPLITVKRRYNQHMAIVEQSSCVNALGKESKDLWPVPITWIDGTSADYKNTTVKLFLDSKDGLLHRLPGKDVWILVNVERTGYFRVNYDENNWKLLLWQLQHNYTVIPTLNRRQLILDALYFSKINQLSHIVALDILTYYPDEKEEAVLKIIHNGESLYYYGNMVKYSNVEGYWKEFLYYLLKPTFIKSTQIWEKESVYKSDYYKWLSIGILCYEGYTPCLLAARNKFADLLEGTIHPLVFQIKDLFCALARHATKEEWNNMNQLFQYYGIYRLISYLACTKDDQLFQRWANDYLFSSERTMDLSMRLSVERWRYITEILKTHWKEINRERFQEIMKSLVNQPHNEETFKMVKELYELHKNNLSKNVKEDIDRLLSTTARLMPTPDAIRRVAEWLKSRSWKQIDIRELNK